jgi:ABC-type sugar transport system permease subunit
MGYSAAISYVLLAIIMIFSLVQMYVLQGRGRKKGKKA